MNDQTWIIGIVLASAILMGGLAMQALRDGKIRYGIAMIIVCLLQCWVVATKIDMLITRENTKTIKAVFDLK